MCCVLSIVCQCVCVWLCEWCACALVVVFVFGCGGFACGVAFVVCS